MKRIFPKGIKVVKGKIVQRQLPSSQAKYRKRQEIEDARLKDDAASRQYAENDYHDGYESALKERKRKTRTGPRLAEGQETKPRFEKIKIPDRYLHYNGGSDMFALNDPRLQKEVRKNKPGRLAGKVDESAEIREEAPRELDRALRRDMARIFRQKQPEKEGRGESPLAELLRALGGKKMPKPLLGQLKGLDPKKLKKITKFLQSSQIVI